MNARPDPFDGWLADLEARHLAELTFAEVRRGVQALSSLYVERRGRMEGGAFAEGAGKRAAFALFYAPLHFLLVREILRALGVSGRRGPILDLGCGTGPAGAAWALESEPASPVRGIDRSGWAIEEARRTYRTLGLRGSASRGDAAGLRLDAGRVVAAFTINELETAARPRMLERLLETSGRGASILIVEPIASSVSPWWSEWSAAFVRSGGRADLWRFPVDLPPILKRLDEAAGLDHAELTGRSIFLG